MVLLAVFVQLAGLIQRGRKELFYTKELVEKLYTVQLMINSLFSEGWGLLATNNLTPLDCDYLFGVKRFNIHIAEY